MASIDIDVLARTAYDAYRRAQKGQVPRWADISATEQQAWRAAVSAVSNRGDATLTDGGPTRRSSFRSAVRPRSSAPTSPRAARAAWRSGDDHASNHHARFQFAHGVWYVEDLNSTNGTWLNGRRMFSPQRLKKNDKVRIGRTVIVVVQAGA